MSKPKKTFRVSGQITLEISEFEIGASDEEEAIRIVKDEMSLVDFEEHILSWEWDDVDAVEDTK